MGVNSAESLNEVGAFTVQIFVNYSINPAELIRIGSKMYKTRVKLHFVAPIFTEVLLALLHYIQIYFTELDPDRAKNVEHNGNVSIVTLKTL